MSQFRALTAPPNSMDKGGRGPCVGLGKRPAVLVINMQHNFCDPKAPMTLRPTIGKTYESIRQLCMSARARGLPVVYTQQHYHAEGRIQIDARGEESIPELAPEPGDHIICKWTSSAFFRTELEVLIEALAIDTLLVCGTSVGGCVRETVTDAFMRGIRCVVIRDSVVDRMPEVMNSNPLAIDQKYADFVSLTEAMDYLNSFAAEWFPFGMHRQWNSALIYDRIPWAPHF